MTITIRSLFKEDGKLYPKVFLEIIMPCGEKTL